MAAELGLDEDFAITDDEEDILDDFISKQKKPKSSKSAVTEKQRKIASDLGLDDDLDIEDLIGEIEADDEAEADKSFDWGTGDTDVCEANINESGAGRNEPEQCSSESLPKSKDLQSLNTCSPPLSLSQSFERNSLLPPIRARPGSLPPLIGAKKPKF